MANKVFILRTSVFINGEHKEDEEKCIPFASYCMAQKVLETIEDSYYHLVTNENWDCSEEREYDKADEPLYWFRLVGSIGTLNSIEGWIDECEVIDKVNDYEVTLTYRIEKEITQTIKVSALNPSVAYTDAEKIAKFKVGRLENGMTSTLIRKGITKLNND